MTKVELEPKAPPEIVQPILFQLTCDLYNCSRSKLADENLVKNLLEVLPQELGIDIFTQPKIVKYEAAQQEDWGISGFSIFGRAHIALHTYPERGFVWIDVASFSPFDREAISQRLKETFRAKAVVSAHLNRTIPNTT